MLSLLLLFISPLAVLGTNTIPEQEFTFVTETGDVLVTPGLTLKYDINELTLPAAILDEEMLENITLPDLSGNQLYVKVMAAENDLIQYAFGLIFKNDATFSIGEGFTALDIIIPEGAATPAIVMGGVPHFNMTAGTPAFFFLNDDWTFHAAALEFGLGVDAELTGTELIASYTEGDTSLDAKWRRSDGVLTSLVIDNANLSLLDLTGLTLDISLASEAVNGISIAAGDVFELRADIATLDITGTGDIYSLIENNITSIQTDVEALKDNVLLKFTVEEVKGLYYTCSVQAWDQETQSLKPMEEEILFNAFLGGFDLSGFFKIEMTRMELDPVFTIGGLAFSLVTPVVTDDFDIYTGYMILLNTAVSVYLDEIIDFIPDTSMPFPVDFNTIDGSFSFEEKRGYKFFNEYLGADITATLEDLEFIPSYRDTSFALDVHAILTQYGWISYSEDNIIAGIRAQADLTLEISSELETLFSGLPTGTITVDLDFKLTNPEYRPPDPLGQGIIPGYTWIVAIPTLLGMAAIGLISRRRK